MGKIHIPKDKQIKGLKKAIANRKTPRQFLPSLKKRLAKLTGAAVFLFALFGLFVSPATAQTPVLIAPTQQNLAPAGTACTGTAQVFPVNNRNQTQHYAYLTPNSALTNMNMVIQGVDSGGNVYPISDTSTAVLNTIGSPSALSGSGYFPTVQVVVTCFPVTTGTFALSYSGSQATTNVNVGSYLISQLDKTVSNNTSANTDYNTLFEPPYGNASGILYFTLTGTGSSGARLEVECESPVGNVIQDYRFGPVTTTGIIQTFVVPPSPCPNLLVFYVHSGASTATYLLDYVFMQPGVSATNTYAHIVGTTATSIKNGPGVLHSLIVGTSAAGTISLFDTPSGACTGTPTGAISVITEFASAAPPPPFYLFDMLFSTGICLKASAAMDITATYQ